MSSLGTHKSVWRVSFDAAGDHLAQSRSHRKWFDQPADTRFLGTLVYDSYGTTRSSAEITLKDDVTHILYRMSLAEFMIIVPKLKDGALTGLWGFKKNGTSTTLAWIDPNSIDGLAPF